MVNEFLCKHFVDVPAMTSAGGPSVPAGRGLSMRAGRPRGKGIQRKRGLGGSPGGRESLRVRLDVLRQKVASAWIWRKGEQYWG